MNALQSPLSPPTRFGQTRKADSPALDRLRQTFANLDSQMRDVYHVSANQKVETPISRARQKIRQGVQAAAIAGTLILASLGTAVGLKNNLASQPNATTIAQNERIRSPWHELIIASRPADVNDPAAQADFRAKSHVFMNSLIQAMAEFPAHPLDAELVNKLREAANSTTGVQPQEVAHKIGLDLILRYLTREKGLPENAGSREMAAALQNVQGEFIDSTPQFSHLSNTQKQELTEQIRRIGQRYAQRNQAIPLNAFDSLFLSSLGGFGFDGVTLEQFAHLKTEADAKRLVSTAIENPQNFRGLTANERATFKQYALEVADNLEYPQGGTALWVLMTLAALGGAGAVAALKRRELLGLPGSFQELSEALKSPVLVITNEDRADKNTQRQLLQLNERIDANAESMAQTVQQVYKTNPAIRDFLLSFFTAENKLPDAHWFRQLASWNAVRTLIAQQTLAERKKGTPIGELKFLQHVWSEIGPANTAGTLLPMPQVEPRPKHNPNRTGREILQAEALWVNDMLTAAMVAYSNGIFGKTSAELALQNQQNEANQAIARFKEIGLKNRDAADQLLMTDEVNEAFTAKQWAEQELVFAKKRLNEAQNTASHAQKAFDQYILPLRQYKARIDEALAKEQTNRTLQQLQKLSENSGQPEQDKHLQAVLEEQQLERFMAQQQATNQEVQARIKARVDQKLAELEQATPHSQS